MMSKKTIWAIIWLCSSTLAFAQDPNAQKFAGEINVKTAKKHLYILASDKFEGRETGKPGAEKAANYIANEFKKLKLTAPVNGSYFQNVPLVETSFEVSSFVSNGKSLSLGKDFLFSGSGGDPKSVNVTEITFIGYGIGSDNYDDLKNTSIAGKVVLLINKGEPMNNGISAVSKTAKASDWSTSRFKRLQYVMSKSPSLILAVSPDVAAALQSYAPRNGRLSIKKESTPASRPANAAIVNITPDLANQILQNSGKTYDALKASIDNSGKPQTQALKAEISMTYGPVNKEVQSVNVLGYLEGTDLKDELVVYSAHYDHIGITTDGGTDKINNGADDDGSGTTGVLSIARAFAKAKKAGHGPRRSVLFLMVTGEEKGLLGSEYYSLNPVYPMANTITNLNIDMIGRTGELYKNHSDSTNYCYLIGSDKLSTDLHKISENANAVYTKMKIDYKYNDPNDPERIYYRSDHYNFAKNGVPIVFYFNGVHEDYHKPSDEVSKINFELLSKRAQLVYYTGWDLLNRDKRPVVDVKNDMPATR